MQQVINSGKYLFAIAILGFSAIQFATGSLPSEFMPLPASMTGRAFLAYLTGGIMTVAAVCIIINRHAKLAAAIIGIVFLLFLIYPHIPKLLSNVHNPGEWVAFLETLAFSCGAFILADKLPVVSAIEFKWRTAIGKAALVGSYLFAIAILIFGIQHIMYEKFIITLIPSWIPGKVFWSYVVKAAFLSSAISIVLKFKTRLALSLLGLMFLLWVLLLHGPRVFKNPTIEPEWTSFFVALAMSGISFLIASGYGRKERNNIEKVSPSMKTV